MSMKKRIEAIERQTEEQGSGYVLVDSTGEVVQGEVIAFPTEKQEGLARLSDGAERAIMFEHDWRIRPAISTHPSDVEKFGDKLRIRVNSESFVSIIHEYVNASEA